MRKIRRKSLYRVGGFIRDKNCFVGQTGYQASKFVHLRQVIVLDTDRTCMSNLTPPSGQYQR